jgi:hypothetical protein
MEPRESSLQAIADRMLKEALTQPGVEEVLEACSAFNDIDQQAGLIQNDYYLPQVTCTASSDSIEE